jgi:hypothetical protein
MFGICNAFFKLFEHMRINLLPAFTYQDCHDLGMGLRRVIRPRGCHGVVAVDHAEYTGMYGNSLPRKLVGIATAVKRLVVVPNDVGNHCHFSPRNGKANCGAKFCMGLHHGPLVELKPAGFQQDAVGDADFSNIVPDADVSEAIDLLLHNGFSCLPVVNEQQNPVGILTWRDLLRHLAAPAPKDGPDAS